MHDANTIKVRIALIVNAQGSWAAFGDGDYSNDENMANAADSLAAFDRDVTEARYWVEVDLPIPETGTLQGTLIAPRST